MVYTKTELRTKAELMLMGYVQTVNTEEDVKFIFDIFLSAIPEHIEQTADELYNDAMKYIETEKTEIFAMSCSTVYDNACINVIFRDKENVDKFDLCSDEGLFCYTINLSDPNYSEYGYSFFGKKGEGYHRIS